MALRSTTEKADTSKPVQTENSAVQSKLMVARQISPGVTLPSKMGMASTGSVATSA